MRRQIKIFIALIIVLSSFLSLSACGQVDLVKYQKFSFEFFGTFDTVIQITGYAESQEEFDKYSEYAYQRFVMLHKLYDNYNNYDEANNIKTINDSAGIRPVKVSDELIELLSFCVDFNVNISDKVDITMGSVLAVWHEYREAGLNNPETASVPTESELLSANQFTGMENMIIDEERSTVYLMEGTALDLGAVAKGFATELVASELSAMGFQSFLISSGGNVKAVGAPMDESRKTWSIGLQNPFYFENQDAEENLIDIAYLNDMSVVTSGDYQRFYTVDEVQYHHIIDPVTLFPADYYRSVTIFTQDSGVADFLSTALFLTPFEEGVNLIQSLEGVDAYWIFSDGGVYATEGAKDILKNYDIVSE